MSQSKRAKNFAQYDNVIILGIQNGEYDKTRKIEALKNMCDLTQNLEEDLKVFKNGMKGLGYEVRMEFVYTDMDKKTLLSIFGKLNTIAVRKKGTLFIVYYGGHGAIIHGKLKCTFTDTARYKLVCFPHFLTTNESRGL